jgi:hypothetical protein
MANRVEKSYQDLHLVTTSIVTSSKLALCTSLKVYKFFSHDRKSHFSRDITIIHKYLDCRSNDQGQ